MTQSARLSAGGSGSVSDSQRSWKLQLHHYDHVHILYRAALVLVIISIILELVAFPQNLVFFWSSLLFYKIWSPFFYKFWAQHHIGVGPHWLSSESDGLALTSAHIPILIILIIITTIIIVNLKVIIIIIIIINTIVIILIPKKIAKHFLGLELSNPPPSLMTKSLSPRKLVVEAWYYTSYIIHDIIYLVVFVILHILYYSWY